VVMVTSKPTRGWKRDGFGVERGGRGAGRFGRRGFAWHRIDRAGDRGDHERGDPDPHHVDQERADHSARVDRAVEVEAKKKRSESRVLFF
jgi:hypothetical protein